MHVLDSRQAHPPSATMQGKWASADCDDGASGLMSCVTALDALVEPLRDCEVGASTMLNSQRQAAHASDAAITPHCLKPVRRMADSSFLFGSGPLHGGARADLLSKCCVTTGRAHYLQAMGAEAAYNEYKVAINPVDVAAADLPYLDGTYTGADVAAQFLVYCKEVAKENDVASFGAQPWANLGLGQAATPLSSDHASMPTFMQQCTLPSHPHILNVAAVPPPQLHSRWPQWKHRNASSKLLWPQRWQRLAGRKPLQTIWSR